MGSIILFFQLFYKIEVFFKKVGGRKVALLLKKKNLTQKCTGLERFKAFFLINSFLSSLPEASLSISFIKRPHPDLILLVLFSQ